MKLLLLLEADEGFRRELAGNLRSDGHDVIEVNAERALELCQERIDAVLVRTAQDAARAVAAAPVLPRAVAAAPVLIGETTAMRDLRATLRRLSSRPRTHVLVGGEAGSGKHTLARALHHVTSEAEDFVHLSGSRLANLLESGLAAFGSGATLYVPSIEDVEKTEQRRLAELFADHEGVDAPAVRLVVGALRSGPQLSLGRLVQRAVHPALAARIPVLLDILPLRKRKSDIPLIVSHLLEARSQNSGLPRPELTPAALEALLQHSWPGNVRELANVLECASLAGGLRVDATDLPAFEATRAGIDYELPSSGIDFFEFERAMLVQALRLTRGNQTQAAALLGLTRDQIRYRMSKFNIQRSEPERE